MTPEEQAQRAEEYEAYASRSIQQLAKLIREKDQRITTLEAENKAFREGLRPFAAKVPEKAHLWLDDDWLEIAVKTRAVRRAAELLKGEK